MSCHHRVAPRPLGVFGTVVAVSLARGRRFDCGCGLSGDAEISWWHVKRSALLAALSMLIAADPAVLAINASHVDGGPATNELVAVPPGVLLLCSTWRLISLLRQNASIIRAARLAHRAVVRPPIEKVCCPARGWCSSSDWGLCMLLALLVVGLSRSIHSLESNVFVSAAASARADATRDVQERFLGKELAEPAVASGISGGGRGLAGVILFVSEHCARATHWRPT